MTKFLTPLMLCALILYMTGGILEYQSRLRSEDFWEIYHCNFINFLKSAGRKSLKKYFFRIHLVGDVWTGVCAVASRLMVTPCRDLWKTVLVWNSPSVPWCCTKFGTLFIDHLKLNWNCLPLNKNNFMKMRILTE